MLYLVQIRLEDKRKRTFRIEASNEEEAVKKLPNRLPPSERESFTLESVKVDPSTLGDEEPYGVFLNE